MSILSRFFAILLACVTFTLAGCGSGNIGTVTGTVKADGKPLAGALVQFYPKAGGGASQGRTAADGTYELIRDRETKGAVPGEYEVRISTAGAAEGDYSKVLPEKLPAKYNLKSELSQTVNAGKNVIDFDLDYEGIIIQPR